MPFDKYLFEKYIKDCVVQILIPNNGTGFWILPDGHILTCYHVLVTKEKDFWGNETEITNKEVQITYHGKHYTAVLDNKHSKKELDIAILRVADIEEKIHFVPLGNPELITEVQVFGYRVDENGDVFKNGYHISGMLRLGQVLNDGGLVYNLETNQPPNSSVGGMSGSPVYDLNTTKVIGMQGSEERRGPSICYVHPIAKVYKLWPELRIKNFDSIRKDFNIYFMASDLPRCIFCLSMAFLQSQIEKELGKELIGNAEQTLFNVNGEMVTGKLYKILGTSLGASKFTDSILHANKYFHKKCPNGDSCVDFTMPIMDSVLPANKSFRNNCVHGDLCDAFTIPISDLLSMQAALKDLPKAFNQEELIKIIGENLRRDYPELTETQIETGLDSYLECLKQQLSQLKEFVLSIIAQNVKQISQQAPKNENKISDVLTNLEKYIAQRGIYMVIDDIHTGLGISTIEEQDKGAQVQISILEEILNREPHLSSELNYWKPTEKIVHFLQQAFNRINDDNEGEEELKQDIEKLLTERNQPWLAKYVPGRKALIKHPSPFGIEPFTSLSLAFTVDEKSIISSASFDPTLRLWDIENGNLLRIFEGHSSGLLCVATIPNGKLAFSLSSDKTMRIWDINSGQCLQTSRKERDYIWKVASIPKTQHAILSFSDKLLRRRDLENGQNILTYKGHNKPCSSIAMSSDGKFFISASDDWTLRSWDTNTGEVLNIFDGHLGKVFSVAIIPNSNQIISASEDRTLRIWDISTGQSLRIFKGHSEAVHGVVVTPDGKHAVSASADKTLRLWDISNGKCQSIFTDNESFKCCAIAPQSLLIAAGDQVGEIHFVQIRNR